MWTIDAPFRETMDKVQEYARRGVLAVEMECTALMSIAAYRGINLAAVLVITDELFGEGWVQGFVHAVVAAAFDRLFQALAQSLRE